MTAPSADGPASGGRASDGRGADGRGADGRGSDDAADAVEDAREEFAATLDAIEGKFDLTRRWNDLSSRVRSRVAETPLPVAAVAVAGAAVIALAAYLVVRSRRS